MTDARALAHELVVRTVGCWCYGDAKNPIHTDLCNELTTALAAARNEALEEAARCLEQESLASGGLRSLFAARIRALKDRP